MSAVGVRCLCALSVCERTWVDGDQIPSGGLRSSRCFILCASPPEPAAAVRFTMASPGLCIRGVGYANGASTVIKLGSVLGTATFTYCSHIKECWTTPADLYATLLNASFVPAWKVDGPLSALGHGVAPPCGSPGRLRRRREPGTRHMITPIITGRPGCGHETGLIAEIYHN
ncbi:hypothetical protein [Actinomadura roseirufa]|uniref:hypothetical protein n=1 Tax=Actinomadura roseirufa TaxID=2094049 RepID=UPI00104154EB|nr:hypothetical protein [Actinomadura roseirufa]